MLVRQGSAKVHRDVRLQGLNVGTNVGTMSKNEIKENH